MVGQLAPFSFGATPSSPTQHLLTTGSREHVAQHARAGAQLGRALAKMDTHGGIAGLIRRAMTSPRELEADLDPDVAKRFQHCTRLQLGERLYLEVPSLRQPHPLSARLRLAVSAACHPRYFARRVLADRNRPRR